MEYLLKSTLIIAVLYFFYRIFLQQETFFQSIRVYFIVGVSIALILPLLMIPKYIEVESITTPNITENITLISAEPETELVATSSSVTKSIEWYYLLSILYSIGVFILSIKFLVNIVSLIHLIVKSNKEKKGNYIFITTDKEISPFSFFNYIIYNKNHFSDKELKDIISHEKVHVLQKHSIDILLLQILVIIQWFNPFIWFYKKDAQQNLEYIADQSAQEKSKTNKKYQYLLLKTNIINNPFSLSNNFFNSHIKKRIIMLQKKKTKQLNQIKYLIILPLIAIFLYSFNVKEIITVKQNKLDINLNKVIVIDVSHGGKDMGYSIDGVSEKDIVLAISKKIKSLYRGDATLMFTREKDEFMTLDERVEQINKINPSFMISLHIDHAKNKEANGLRAFVSEKNSDFEKSKQIANKLLKSIANDNLKNKGISKGNLVVIREVKVPAVLLELGFLSNRNDRNYITSEKGQTEIAKSIINYINGEKTVLNEENKSIEHSNNFPTHLPNKEGTSKEKILKTKQSQKEVIITKDNTKFDLNTFKTYYLNKGITLKFKGIKRNSKGEITAIKINARSKIANINYSSNSGKPIQPIKISFDNDTILIGNSNLHDNEIVQQTRFVKIETPTNPPTTTISNQITGDSIIRGLQLSPKTYINQLNGVVGYSSPNHNYNIISVIGYPINDSINHHSNKRIITRKVSLEEEPLVIVNGKVILYENLEDINPDHIKSINFLKGEKSIELYGDKGENGVIIITTKKNGKAERYTLTSSEIKVIDYNKKGKPNQSTKENTYVFKTDDNKNIIIRGSSKPLIILDGKEMKNKKIDDITSDTIESITVLKGKKAIKKYGEKGKHGAIEVTTKK